jgi:hypothetical protein
VVNLHRPAVHGHALFDERARVAQILQGLANAEEAHAARRELGAREGTGRVSGEREGVLVPAWFEWYK